MLKQVICIKWGTRYGPEYANRIYSMVARNVTPPFRVICFTDDRAGIRPEIDCYDLPDLGCPVPTSAPGKWRKTSLWGSTLFDITGVALFIDLDVVITGNIDDFFTCGSPDDVILARNWIRPLERLGQTSVFRYPVGKHGYLLERLRQDPEGVASEYQFEQRYVTRCVRGGVKFFPRGTVKHFRLNCLGPWPLRYLRPARLPSSARMVLFPGKPDPHDAMLGQWSSETGPVGPVEHVRSYFRGDRRMSFRKHFKRYLKPVGWIKEHWRDDAEPAAPAVDPAEPQSHAA